SVIVNWLWDFDGLGSSTQQNPSFSFPATGTYNVSLTVTDDKGCSNTISKPVKIYNNNDIQPAFSYPAILCTNSPILFTDQSSYVEDTIKAWLWAFNGEGSSNEQNPGFTFSTSGSKVVTLSVTGTSGCIYSHTEVITVEAGPTTGFSFNNVCNGEATTFTDATTGSNLTAWSWDFGDGATSTEPSPTHTYANPGKYTVTLTVDNSLGCSTSFTDTVYNHAIPVVGFTNDLACSSAPVQFTDQSVVQDASLVAWQWDFGDGTTASERNPQHLYGQTGDFTVQLKAYSQYGCVDSLSATLSVNQGPEVDFSWDKACASEATSFTDLSNTFGMPVTDYTWLIDGQVYNEQNPQHTFSTAGDYQVTFSVTTDNLCAATASRTLTVEPTPATGFGMEESCQTGNVTFYDTTQAAIASRIWRIDGSQAGSDSLLTLALAPGNYLAALNVVTTAGCNGSALRQITVNGAPQAAFEVPSAYGAAPYTVPFSNLSGNYDSLRWYFGDPTNSTSTAANPTFTYADTGSYQVTLIAYGLTCSDTARLTIEVVEPQHGLALTDIIPLDDGQLVLSLDNTGSLTYNRTNTEVLFSFDNGGTLTEALNTELYALQAINYVPGVRLQDFGNANALCISLYYKDSSGKLLLDKNCLTLTDTYVSAPYPNPATGTASFDVVASEAGTATMRLLSRSGQVVWQETEQPLVRGLNTFTIDTTPYRAGLYILEVSQGGSTSKHKLVIRK
ncbi:MAG TPA: PKD domain-containing protein, partial [Flammeovirgaceae bacterium]|nr:PKD domain-containing protein [Flammeovirgaceae bacterium]